jgi:hypothetical protein
VDPRQDIGTYEVVTGDPLEIDHQVNKPDGSPMDLTTFGTSWSAMLRQSYSSVDVQSFAIDATSASTGLLKLTLTAAQTTSMATAPGDLTTWHFDLQASGGAVSPQTPFKGAVQVWRDFTHG